MILVHKVKIQYFFCFSFMKKKSLGKAVLPFNFGKLHGG